MKIRRSKNGPRRAAVLIFVHIVIVAHVGLWLITGMRTLTPVEPSEAMYTLEQGLVNAGFVFFALALLSTVVFGRFFCGWGCHVVALQDLCSWMMRRMGVHPKPFRSRLLIYVPLLLATYMFVWPTFQRAVLQPVAGPRWASLAPYLGYQPPRPEFQSHFTTTDFWATFPPWYIAIPFLLVCGFGVVYFLGSKGFCTYGCPYGGFFAPLDRLAPGRIVVSDACEGCGHCTAVCTSNVRVHEEVRDYGMVMDSGCMKCMDCVSVCPNNALRFAFAAPAVMKMGRPVPRKAAPKAKQHGKMAKGTGGGRAAQGPLPRQARRYELSWPEEAGAAVAFVVLLVAYRGMFNSIPLLMAVGMAGIGTFLLLKLWRMARVPNVRLQSLQLKFKGNMRPAGWVMGALAALVLVSGVWGAAVKYNLYFADVADAKVVAPMHMVFAPGYTPDAAQHEHAMRAANRLLRAGPPSEGGFGWPWSTERRARLAWLLAVAGEDELAIHHLRGLIHASAARLTGDGPGLEQVGALVSLIARRGGGYEEIASELRAILEIRPSLADVRLALATLELDAGHGAAAIREARRAAADAPAKVQLLVAAAEVLLTAGDEAGAGEVLRQAVAAEPDSAQARARLAIALVLAGDSEGALAELERAYELEPDNPSHARMMAQILSALGRDEEATRWLRRADERGRGMSDPVR